MDPNTRVGGDLLTEIEHIGVPIENQEGKDKDVGDEKPTETIEEKAKGDDNDREPINRNNSKSKQGTDDNDRSDETTVTYETTDDFRGVCDVIRRAAADAIKYDDYISYATILEELLKDPSKYTDEEKAAILQTLLDILQNNDKLVYEIGWDMPLVVLEYVTSKYDFSEGLRYSSNIKLVMQIFNVLCEKGNAKELFLKACEALTNLNFSAADDTAMVNKFTEETVERYNTVKFYLCFELMTFSLRRIKTQYASRFLATAITVLLSFVASNEAHFSLFSLGVIVRRLFVFCRDYALGGEADVEQAGAEVSFELSSEEQEKVVKLLQTYVTWVGDLALQRFSIRWSQRLYCEMKAKVETADLVRRKEAYEISIHTARLIECLERLAQFSYSVDLDVVYSLREIVGKTASETEEEKEEERTDDSDFSSLLSKTSDDGILILATQLSFDDRSIPGLSMNEIVSLADKYLNRTSGSAPPLGVQDAVIYWTLWSTRKITEKEVQTVPHEQFSNFLQQLMLVCTQTPDKDSRYIVFSLCAKLLKLHSPEVSFEILVDLLEYCPFSSLKEAAIRILKCLSVANAGPCCASADISAATETASTTSSDISSVQQSLNQLSISDKPQPRIILDAVKQAKVLSLIDDCMDIITQTGISTEEFGVLLSWLNFVTVVPLPEQVENVNKFIQQAKSLVKENDKSSRNGVLTLAVESAEKRRV